MILDPKIFYKTYPAEFHWYKARMLKFALENKDNIYENAVSSKYNNEELDRFERMLKLEMRQTYFHCMEAMFTLLLALDPLKNSLVDEDVLHKMTAMDIEYIYSRVQSFANDPNSLKFLNKQVRMGNSKVWVHVGKFIFYKGIAEFNPKMPDMKQEIEESLDAIIYGLQLFAKDFSDRDEYNSYKHGLRLVPTLQSIIFADVETYKDSVSFDFGDSVSFFRRQKKADTSESIDSVTRVFNTERDYEMTTFCSNLICSMIESRRALYYNDSTNGLGVSVRLYGKEAIEKCMIPDKPMISFKITKR